MVECDTGSLAHDWFSCGVDKGWRAVDKDRMSEDTGWYWDKWRNRGTGGINTRDSSWNWEGTTPEIKLVNKAGLLQRSLRKLFSGNLGRATYRTGITGAWTAL